MESLVIRNIDDHLLNALTERAALNGRTLEAEVKEILFKGVRPQNPLRRLHQIVVAHEATGELQLPGRPS